LPLLDRSVLFDIIRKVFRRIVFEKGDA